MGVTAAVTRGRIFPDTDHAIEWAEDRLIFTELGDTGTGAEFPFNQLDVLADFTPEDLETIKTMLQRRTYAKGELVFREGDSSAVEVGADACSSSPTAAPACASGSMRSIKPGSSLFHLEPCSVKSPCSIKRCARQVSSPTKTSSAMSSPAPIS